MSQSCWHRGRTDIAHVFQPFLPGAGAWLAHGRDRGTALWYDWDDQWTDGGLLDCGQRGGLSRRWDYYWTHRMEWWMPRQAAGITVCSRWLRDRAVERGGRRADVVHNGFWRHEYVSKREAREILGMDPHARYLGYMGRSHTGAELAWCMEALAETGGARDGVRLAFCGLPAQLLENVPVSIREQVDILGEITPTQAEHFARAIDLGLLPLHDNPFNQSRFPIRFAHYLAAGTPVLCSQVGELQLLSDIGGVIQAGSEGRSWKRAQAGATALMQEGRLPEVDAAELQRRLCWQELSRGLERAYLAAG